MQIENFSAILYYFFMNFENFTVNSYKKFSEHIGMFCNSTNVGVLNTKDSIFLIDTGSSAQDAKNLLESLAEIFPNKKVKAIFNTHSHSDHCGGNAYVVEKTNCKVGAPYFESLIMQFPYLTGALYWGAMPFEDLAKQGFVNQVANKVDFILTSCDDANACADGAGGFVDETGGFVDGTGGLVRETGGLTRETDACTRGTGDLVDGIGGLARETDACTRETGGLTQETGGLAKKATLGAKEAAVELEKATLGREKASVVAEEAVVFQEKVSVVAEEPTVAQEKPQVFAKELQNPLEKVKVVKGKIELEELCVEIISLPGHFFDQVGFLVTDKSENKKVFFLGDGFFGIPLLKRFWIPFIYEPEDFRKSVEKIEEIYADFYVPSHGDFCVLENLEAIAEFNIIVTLEFEKLIKKLLLEKPQNQEELLKSVADYAGLELKESNYILIGTTLRSYLSSMNKRGILEHKVVENRLIWFVC